MAGSGSENFPIHYMVWSVLLNDHIKFTQIAKFLFFVSIILWVPSPLHAQAENVPTDHPVYRFLKRMEVKGIIERYYDAVLPLSRRQIAGCLKEVRTKERELTGVEVDILEDFFTEFEYDVYGTTEGYHMLVDSREPSFGAAVSGMLTERQKFLYGYADTNVTFFVDGLLTLDSRKSTSETLREKNATFVQFGGRMRGTVFSRLGYYLQATNAQFWGSRELLFRDKLISQSYGLATTNARNFDFTEGYVRYDGDIVSAQLGRERLLWGNSYGDKLIASDNVRVYDFIRLDAEYKAFKYTFLHAWLLGSRSHVIFTLPSDTSYQFVEPVNADKYFAAHRFSLSFPSLFDIGFQEIAIYSNRSPDLAYLNPMTLIESAQRSRDERDNVLWAFDIKTRIVKGWQLHAGIVFDDINFPDWGTDVWANRYAYQIGGMAVDPFGVPNVTLAAEYTRVEPYTFSHGRSRDNSYTSGGRMLGHHIGPNADSWFFRLDYLFSRKLISSFRFETQREGNNIYDTNTGMLVKNVGGDILQPHRDGKDADIKEFLGGNLVKTSRFQAFVVYEIVNQMFLEVRYEMQRRRESLKGTTTTEYDFGIALRIDL